MILGASLVDLTLIGWEAVRRLRGALKEAPEETPPNQRVNFKLFIAWVLFWGVVTTILASQMLQQPVTFILLALGLVLLFLLVNGISTGISDSNPISSAFVLSVLLMSVLGLRDPLVGLFAASILLICCAVGVDMQQALATGRRLGTSRTIQFHFQWMGVIIGAVVSILLAGVFFKAYPDLTINAVHQEVPKWQSAMTYKIVGILEDIGNLKPHQTYALLIGLTWGLVIQITRKLLKGSAGYQDFLARCKASAEASTRWKGLVTDVSIDAFLLSSPYAFSFGGFVDVPTVAWFAVGGVICSAINFWSQRKVQPGEEMPEEIGTTFLVGGGLIAGDALFALGLGMWGLFGLLLTA
jgi:uncharacterized oligopeptide transporter (OPT) family protein